MTLPQALLKPAAFELRRPDIIISDLAMPDGDGFSLIARVRSMTAEAGGRVPAIALSAFSAPKIVDRALRSGFNRFLAKPISLDRLFTAVDELLR